MENKFTSFLAIQQVTKQGEFVGSNKLKHLFDAMGEMRRASNRDGGQTYITFTKNRNGDVGIKLGYTLENGSISYWVMEENNQQQPEEVEMPDYEFEVN
jgi:predicted ATP-dependent serine protease